MSWVPPDLSLVCQPGSQLSTCQPSTFMFLAFLANLLGYSKDSISNKSKISPHPSNSLQPSQKKEFSPRSEDDANMVFDKNINPKILESPNAADNASSTSSISQTSYYPSDSINLARLENRQHTTVDNIEVKNEEENEPPNSSIFPRRSESLSKEYDFIVVGAGTAGCVITNRLSKNKNWKVIQPTFHIRFLSVIFKANKLLWTKFIL